MDVGKQIAHWMKGADEDLAVAQSLLNDERIRHALFFAELAVEKALKALVTKETNDVPPKTHDLLRLAALANISLPDHRKKTMARIQQFSLEGRYPDFIPVVMSPQDASAAFADCRELVIWLKSLLS
ncbi:MAG: HEPN domain-containing protein [Thermodesulfobacteriota bacterium]